MKKMSKLRRVTEYFKSLELYMEGVSRPALVIAAGDATKFLTGKSAGIQVLLARPECSAYGTTDTLNETVSAAVFILAKSMSSEISQDKQNEIYDKLLDVTETVISRIQTDITGGDCSLLSGLDLTNVDVVPEMSLFGGWTGYSLDLQFR